MGLLSTLKDFVADLVDPRGPIGNWLSPTEVYKERLGLPIQSPHNQRIQLETSAAVEHALAPAKFISAEEAINVPKSRHRIVSAFVEERWTPVYAKTDSTDLGEILKASQTLVGWTVTQHERSAYCDCSKATFEREGDEFVHKACGRSRKHLSNEQFAQQVQQQRIQAMADEDFNGLIETLPGNDPVIVNGEYLRGTPVYDDQGRMVHDGIVRGTMITHGRREYNERTKNAIFWDAGYIKQREAALAEEDSRPVRNVQRALEAVAGEVLPMHRPVGINFRRDRRSGV